MADREQPYDPYIPAGQTGGASAGQDGSQRTAALQAVGRIHLPRPILRYPMPGLRAVAFAVPIDLYDLQAVYCHRDMGTHLSIRILVPYNSGCLEVGA